VVTASQIKQVQWCCFKNLRFFFNFQCQILFGDKLQVQYDSFSFNAVVTHLSAQKQ